jgi:hypothetical protein
MRRIFGISGKISRQLNESSTLLTPGRLTANVEIVERRNHNLESSCESKETILGRPLHSVRGSGEVGMEGTL